VQPDERAAPAAASAEPEGASPEEPVSASEILARWPQIMRHLHEKGKVPLYASLQKVIVEGIVAENRVVTLPLRPGDKVVRSILENSANRKALEEAIRAVLGGQWGIRCVTIDTQQAATPQLNLSDLDYLDQIAAEASAPGANREKDI
jgi:hypothetical protein